MLFGCRFCAGKKLWQHKTNCAFMCSLIPNVWWFMVLFFRFLFLLIFAFVRWLFLISFIFLCCTNTCIDTYTNMNFYIFVDIYTHTSIASAFVHVFSVGFSTRYTTCDVQTTVSRCCCMSTSTLLFSLCHFVGSFLFPRCIFCKYSQFSTRDRIYIT